MEGKPDFFGRGGWWALAQIVLITAAFVLPSWTGAPVFDTGNPVQVIGLAIAIAGGLFALVGLLTLGNALTPFPYPRTQAPLRSRGIFTLARHPLYGGLIIATLGWTLFRLSPWGVVSWIALFIFFDRKADREEMWLTKKHGEYAAFRARTRKLIPWIY